MPVNNNLNKPTMSSKITNHDVWSDAFTGTKPVATQSGNQSSNSKQSFDAFKDVFSAPGK